MKRSLETKIKPLKIESIMTRTELLNLLTATKEQTLNFFILSEPDLSKQYAIGKWSIKEILHHLTDTEVLLHVRLKKIIAEPRQVIWAFNQDDWNTAFDYKHASLHNKELIFQLFRDLNYELIEKFYDNYGSKEFIHNETGLRTLKDEFEKVGMHNHAHNQQILQALAT
jgi:hypothetical protein